MEELDIAKHLVRFETDRVPAAPLSHRRHDFEDQPQASKRPLKSPLKASLRPFKAVFYFYCHLLSLLLLLSSLSELFLLLYKLSRSFQVMKYVEGVRTLSPRKLQESARADVSSPTKRLAADFQHRTSGEMAAAVQPELSPRACGAEKYVVGTEIFDLEQHGVRKSLQKA